MQIVRGSCFSCKKILEDSVLSEHIIQIVRLMDAGLLDTLDGLREIYCKINHLNATKVIEEMKVFVDTAIQG